MATFLIIAILGAITAFVLPVSVSAGMINLAGFFLGIAGMFLDLALKSLVVQFDAQIYSAIADTVGYVWTAFRDMSNIVIIGMFTFISISMILGVEQFGTRKMVARVLIIAVLINFSLLFTRIVIGTSNFVAGKFYVAMSLDSIANTAGAAAPVSGGALDTIVNYASTAGISGQFVNLMGLPSALNARDTVNVVYDQNGGRWGAGGITAMLYGVTTAILMMATALVLAYAIFLLIARTVLFLFLLTTSSLAFAAYLVPQWGDQYWKMWWGSLLRNAVFAPLLMIMLWTTLIISYALVKGPGQNRSFDKLFSDPTQGSGVMALLIFSIILGMLYASIRFASSFSKKIDGFSWASIAPAFGIGIGARIAALAGRQTIGRGSAWAGRKMQEASKDTVNRSLWTRQLYDFGAQQFKGVAKSEMNIMRGTLGKEILGVTGLKKLDTLAGTMVKGFEGSQKARAEAFAEKASRMKLDEKETAEMAKGAVAQILKENPSLGKAHDEASTAVAESQKQLKNIAEKQGETLDAFAQNMKTMTNSFEKAQQRAIENPASTAAKDEVKNLEKAMRDARADHEASMNQQKQRIEDAKLMVERGQLTREKVLRKAVEKAVEKGMYPKDAGALASEMAHKRFSNTLLRIANISTEQNDQLARLAGKQIKEKKKKEGIKDAIAELRKAEKEDKDAHATENEPGADH